MFCLSESDTFYLYPYPVDMRKSFYSLGGIVTNEMKCDVQDGEAFIFVNRSLTSMKILHAEYGGLMIYNLKLERGCISLPDMQLDADDSSPYRLTQWQGLMAQGINPLDMKRSPRWLPQKSENHRNLGPLFRVDELK